MKRTFQLIVMSAITILVIGGLALGLVGSDKQVAKASPLPQEEGSSLPRTITVVGEGRVEIEPNMAQITIGVETFAPTVQEAATQAEETMNSLISTLTAQGVAEEDIQTTNYNVFSERFGGPPGPGGAQGGEVNYRFSNNVTVTVRNLEDLETLLGAAIEAGANNIYGVNFSVSDISEVRKDARAEAVTSAQEKAQELAGLNGVEVGEVISVSEVIGGGGQFPNRAALSYGEGMGGGGGGPISPGQMEVTVQLQVTYAIQ